MVIVMLLILPFYNILSITHAIKTIKNILAVINTKNLDLEALLKDHLCKNAVNCLGMIE